MSLARLRLTGRQVFATFDRFNATPQIASTRSQSFYTRSAAQGPPHSVTRRTAIKRAAAWGSLVCLRPMAGVRSVSVAAGASEPYLVAAYVTVPDLETGKKIAKGVVETKLAACVNIIPGLTSVYEWEGEVNMDSELLLMIKTKSALLDELTKKVVALHPYDVCEVIGVPIVGGNEEYLKWVRETTIQKTAT